MENLPKEGLGTAQSAQLMTQIQKQRVSFISSVDNRICFWKNKVKETREKLQKKKSAWQSQQLALALGKLRMSQQGKQA
eukprot:2494874-Rhodomonas_salina.1